MRSTAMARNPSTSSSVVARGISRRRAGCPHDVVRRNVARSGADRQDRWIGEHARRCHHVVEPASAVAHQCVGDHSGMVVGQMGVLTEAGDVADCPQRRWPRDPAVRAHGERFGPVEPDVFEAEVRSARSRSCRHQQAIGVDVRTGVEHGADPATTSFHPVDRDPTSHHDTGSGERRVDDATDLGREIRECVRRGVEQVHLGTEPGEDRRQFAADHAAADDRESHRLLLGGHRVDARPAPFTERVEARDRRYRDLGAGRQDDVVGAIALTVSVDRTTFGQSCSRANQGGAVAFELERMVGVVEMLGDVEAAAHRLAPAAPRCGVVQHRLRRHAGNERTLAPDALWLEHHDAATRLKRARSRASPPHRLRRSRQRRSRGACSRSTPEHWRPKPGVPRLGAQCPRFHRRRVG